MLVVWKLDRLGRNLAHLVNTVQDLSARGAGLRVLAGDGAQIDTTTAAGRLVFGIFAALAEFERELTRERTVAGLKAARARGRKGGRKFALSKAGPGRDGAPRHVGVPAVPRARHQAGDALPVRRPAGPGAGGGLRLNVGFRPLPQTTRTGASDRASSAVNLHPGRRAPSPPFVRRQFRARDMRRG